MNVRSCIIYSGITLNTSIIFKADIVGYIPQKIIVNYKLDSHRRYQVRSSAMFIHLTDLLEMH